MFFSFALKMLRRLQERWGSDGEPKGKEAEKSEDVRLRQSRVRELSGSFCVFSPSSYVICTPREEQKLLPSLPVPA